jgi:hypothetical protein
MTLGTRALATRNKQSIIFQYDMICQTKDCKNWYFCFSNWLWLIGLVVGQICSRSNRPQVKSAPVKSAPSQIGHISKIKWKYRYPTLFFLTNATCIIIFILIIILYCLLNTVSTNQIPLNQQLHIPEIPKWIFQQKIRIHINIFIFY